MIFIDGTSRDVRTPEEEEQQEQKVWPPQLQRNHRAQLRSHARHVHEDETEIDFPVGVPKGLTPPTSNIYIYIYICI